MFNSICFRIRPNAHQKHPMDLGFIAESLIFYRDVHILANKQILEQLVTSWGPETTLELLEEGLVKLSYEYDTPAIMTTNSGSNAEKHQGIAFHAPGHSLSNVTPEIFQNLVGKQGKGRRLALRFQKLVNEAKRSENLFEDFKLDLLDKDYISQASKKFFSINVPEYDTSNLVFEVSIVNNEYIVNTNANFIEANKFYHRRIPASHSSLTQAYFLSHLLTARENIGFASQLNTDLALDEINSALFSCRVNTAVGSLNSNLNQMQSFQDFVFNESRAIREAINSGSKSYKDLIELLKKAKKFQDWIHSQPLDANLTKNYFQEVTKSTWVDSLPNKSLRWSIFTGIGLAVDSLGAGGLGTATGVAISAADNFLLDKLIRGWKPNQFIEGPLKDFLKK